VPTDVIGEESIPATFSPWLFSEIALTRLIRRRPKETHRPTIEKLAEDLRKSLKVKYLVPLDHLDRLDAAALNRWHGAAAQRKWIRDSNALDVLYEMQSVTDGPQPI
jgi:hypothetical protein